MLNGKVVVVTGAGGGIGRDVVGACQRWRGTVVAVHHARGPEEAAPPGTGAAGQGSPALHRAADVTDPVSMEALANGIQSDFGRVDGLVALVGRRPPPRAIQDMSLEEWSACLSTNLLSTFLSFRAFVPMMIEKGGGSLVAISSIAGRQGSSEQSAYAAAKAGVVGLVRALAAELGPYAVRVNSVTPGATRTTRSIDLIAGRARSQHITEEAAERELVAGAPLGRMVQPREVGEACAFLLSDISGGITGEDLNVSGGAVMY